MAAYYPTGNVTIASPSYSSGTYLTVNAGSGGGFAPTYNTTWASPSTNTASIQVQGSAQIHGDTHIDGNLTVKGESITELLKDIRDRLALFVPNPVLEEEFDELRELATRYRLLEAQLIEKKRVWEILKKE